MRLSFECEEPLAALSRALDQVRRLGIGLRGLSARGGAPGCTVRIDLEPVDPAVGSTLFERIGQIGGVRLLRWEREPGRARDSGAGCHA